MEERETNVFLEGNLGYVAKGFEILGCSHRHVFLSAGKNLRLNFSTGNVIQSMAENLRCQL